MRHSTPNFRSPVELHFFHGFLGAPTDWNLITPYFTTETSYTHHLNDIFIPQAPSVLIGYSMGGRAALKTYFSAPELVRGIVLISSNLGLSSAALREERNAIEKTWIEKMTTEGMPKFIDWWYSLPLFAEFRSGDAYTSIFEQRCKKSIADAGRELKHFSIAQSLNYWEKISEIPIPIYFLFGEHDTKYRSVFKKCCGLKKDMIKGCGHVLHLEAPAECALLIKQFIEVIYD